MQKCRDRLWAFKTVLQLKSLTVQKFRDVKLMMNLFVCIAIRNGGIVVVLAIKL